jgi:hypothetical protein
VGDTDFEVGFPAPSLENPSLFAEYARRVESHLRATYGPEAGYSVKARHVDDRRKREWKVGVRRGWLSGAEVRITPNREAPHRARVSVGWSSRLFEVLALGGIVLTLPVALLLFVALAFFVRLLGALLVVGIVVVVWVVFLTFACLAVARVAARLFGDEFDSGRRAEMAAALRAISLPAAPRPGTHS